MLESKLCLYRSMARVGDNISIVQKTDAKEVRECFFRLSYDISRGATLTRPLSKGNYYLLSLYCLHFVYS